MRRRCALIIRRDDHKSDSLGAIFLGVTRGREPILEAVERYLGRDLKVISVDEATDALRVEVEATSFADESTNLVRLARNSAAKGRQRAAADLFAEALRLDPLNAEALRGLADLHMEGGALAAAEAAWILAAEIAGFDARTLRSLAIVALEQGRRPTAKAYLEEALRADPSDRHAQEMFAELLRQLEIRFAEAMVDRAQEKGGH